MLIDLETYQDELFNSLISKLQESDTRFVINYGGAGSSKSYTQTQHEIIKCLQGKEKLLVIRKVNTTLKDSVISLFTTILNNWGLSEIYTENKSLQYLQFSNGSQILFKGMDDPEKIKSIAGITRVWIEEASELTKDDFMQLNLRLRGSENLQMTLTFNPIDEEHWIKKHFFDNEQVKERTTIIKTTYQDNKFIDEAYKQELESYKDFDKNYYKIYALGEWGGITEGRIFPLWEQIESFPEIDGAWFGLDFGFSNDPTAIVKTVTFREKIYLDEVLYQKGLTNSDIAKLLKESGYFGEPVICDSAEPKSIMELQHFGINAIGADKRAGSIMAGIDFLKRHKILVTSRSTNIIRENRYYQWKQDKNGKFINQPKDWMNHCFDGNTLISTTKGEIKISDLKVNDIVLTSFGYNKIISNGITGCKKIFEYRIFFDTFVIKLKCTDNHLIYTDKGWIQISNLVQGMTVYLNRRLIMKSLDYTLERGILAEGEKGFMLKCINILKGKYSKGIRFTTKTGIHSIIASKTLIALKGINTKENTEKKGLKKIKSGLITFIQKGLLKQRNGIEAKKARNGIRNTQKTLTSGILHMVHTFARCVNVNLKQILSIKNFAQINASQNTEGIQESIILNQSANVEKCLHTPNIQNKDIVLNCVVQNIKSKYVKTDYVWDLTIEQNNEFFANGLLVHNSIDGIRYAYSIQGFSGKNESVIVDYSEL